MSYSEQELRQTRREALEEARSRPVKREMAGGDGRLTQRIHRKAYWNAVRNHGVSPKDDGYWKDMERLYPEIVVQTQGKTSVSMSMDRVRGAKRRTRFGNSTYHKSFG